MSDIAVIARLPDVKCAVRADLRGTLLDSVRMADAESVAAVVGFLTSTLVQGGDYLGLGALRRVTVTGEKKSSLVVVAADSAIYACVEPPPAIAAVEKAVDIALQGRK